MKYGSLFTGIGGFDHGFDLAGWECAWQVEQEPFCNAILKTHWPAVQRFTDVRRVGKADLEAVDCITAGVPCQDVSIAGRRAGLRGERTGLFYEFARILTELRPAWFVFENVPGLFSSNRGRDFAEVLRILMVECGYGVSWRVLDSRYFNVAQRRERVFIIGRLGEICPAEILFERPGGERDSTAGGEAREDIAVPLTSGSGESRPGRRMEDDWNIVAATLRECDGHHGRSSPRGDGCDTFVIQDVRGRRDKRQNGIGISESNTMYSLTKVDRHAVAFSENQRGEVVTNEVTHQLTSGGGKAGQGYPACAYFEHEERSGVEQHAAGEVDGAVQRDVNDGAAPDTDGVRDFAGLPKGMDSPRYRALGNAVTATVSHWIAKRLAQQFD